MPCSAQCASGVCWRRAKEGWRTVVRVARRVIGVQSMRSALKSCPPSPPPTHAPRPLACVCGCVCVTAHALISAPCAGRARSPPGPGPCACSKTSRMRRPAARVQHRPLWLTAVLSSGQIQNRVHPAGQKGHSMSYHIGLQPRPCRTSRPPPPTSLYHAGCRPTYGPCPNPHPRAMPA